jgi:hypothetical protein
VRHCVAKRRAVHGHDRAAELAGAIAAGTATVVVHTGTITRYATMIGFFGHAVVETNADLAALIAAAPAFPGPGFPLPMRNAELFRWCLGEGLRVVLPLTLMTPVSTTSRGAHTCRRFCSKRMGRNRSQWTIGIADRC